MNDEQNKKPRKLSASEVTDLFKGMNRSKATNYLRKSLMNPETPTSNVDLMLQFRNQNPDKFLTQEEMEQSAKRRSFPGKDVRVSFGVKKKNTDSEGNPKIMSFEDITKMFDRMDPGRATHYVRKALANSKSPKENIKAMKDYAAVHPDKILSDEKLKIFEASRPSRVYDGRDPSLYRNGPYDGSSDYGNGLGRRSETYYVGSGKKVRNGDYRGGYSMERDSGYENPKKNERHFWSNLWKTKEEFDSMAPKEKKFFVRAFRNKTRAQNAAYGLRVMTSPTTSLEDKRAMADVVNSHKTMFFRKSKEDEGGYKVDD